MSRPVRIGNAHGFWGDRIDAAAEMLAAEPELDYITLDFLAEVSMSILALQRSRDPDAGWPRDVADVIRSLIPYWHRGGRCRLITNGGGLNPAACARACQSILVEAGCGDLRVAVVSGDDVIDQLKSAQGAEALFQNVDTGTSLATVQERLVTANAYLGAEPIVAALKLGADIVITGRVADPSLTVAACAHFHGWKWNDWNRLAGATVAGHVIECGTQVTGGISTDWFEVPGLDSIGFPIVEVADDGSFVITKPCGSGGHVCEQTVKEQLVYEIGDPGNYLSPDVTVSFLTLHLTEVGRNRMEVKGVTGRPAPATLKVSATYQDGYRAQGELTIYGSDAVNKARRAGQTVLQRLRNRGVLFRESLVECLGTGACHPGAVNEPALSEVRETVLRIAVADDSRPSIEQFSRELMPLITAGPPGTTGYSAGRPRIHSVFRYWPCLIERERVTARVSLIGDASTPSPMRETTTKASQPVAPMHNGFAIHTAETLATVVGSITFKSSQLGHLAYARSGDKGIHANVGVVARRLEDYDLICRVATVERVAAHFGIDDVQRVIRCEWPNLGAVNFILHGILANTLRVDAQGKALGQVMLELPIPPDTEGDPHE
ncbi:MAG: DUF1446 domain-containing protein [Planctomycetes bacterium]|nr:DUF1446 domain-containing protein [Planctomycetota bacterium]